MKRRTFLSASGATLASILLPKLSLAEPVNRAAIVIGVDRSGSLPVLRDAVEKELADGVVQEMADIYAREAAAEERSTMTYSVLVKAPV
ncbi:MAG: hypothetical protein KZQ93_08690 [Candidatus Thiodiazotropha sp. (ex Monitilora ramsayi)]|nr:hypothetical protein [Candidatus Thiodiazotropha sp. (ex Monitilora ramsayi)]